MNDELQNQCKSCKKRYNNKNQEKTKTYYSENRDKMKNL